MFQREVLTSGFVPTKDNADPLSSMLYQALSIVSEFCALTNDFAGLCQRFKDSRNADDVSEMTSEMAAKWIDKNTDSVFKATKDVNTLMVKRCQELTINFDNVAGRYTALHLQFMKALEVRQETNPMMQFLHSRLDFGDHLLALRRKHQI